MSWLNANDGFTGDSEWRGASGGGANPPGGGAGVGLTEPVQMEHGGTVGIPSELHIMGDQPEATRSWGSSGMGDINGGDPTLGGEQVVGYTPGGGRG